MNERERIIEACQRLTGMTPFGWQLDFLIALASANVEPQLIFVPGGRMAGRSTVLTMAAALEEAHELRLEPASLVGDQWMRRAAEELESWYDGLITPDEVRAIRKDFDRRMAETLSRRFDDATQCKATTFESRRCQRRRTFGSDYCKQHGARVRAQPVLRNGDEPGYLLRCDENHAHLHLTKDARLRGFTVMHCPGENREVTPEDCNLTFIPGGQS